MGELDRSRTETCAHRLVDCLGDTVASPFDTVATSWRRVRARAVGKAREDVEQQDASLLTGASALLQPLLRDPKVLAIYIDGTAPVYVQRADSVVDAGVAFESEAPVSYTHLTLPTNLRV